MRFAETAGLEAAHLTTRRRDSMPNEEGTETVTKLGIHKNIAGPFIGLVSVSIIAWVGVLLLLGRDSKA
jgi:hypothetical protein